MWQNYDLDHILIHGDKVYKFQNRNCTLSVDDLPSTIELENSVFHITKLENLQGEVKYYRPFLRDMFNACVNKGTGFLLFIALAMKKSRQTTEVLLCVIVEP